MGKKFKTYTICLRNADDNPILNGHLSEGSTIHPSNCEGGSEGDSTPEAAQGLGLLG